MTAASPFELDLQAPAANQWRVSETELKTHAESCGISADLLKIQDNNAPDCVTVTIGKPDGRSIRRVVPRESWNQPAYRASLIRDMNLMLA